MTRDSKSLIDQASGQDSWSAGDSSSDSEPDTKTTADPDTGTSSKDSSDTTDENTDGSGDSEWSGEAGRRELDPDIVNEEAKAVTQDGEGDAAVHEPEPESELVDAPGTDDEVDEYLDLAVIQVNYTTRYLNDDTERATIHAFCRVPEGEGTDDVEEGELIRVDVHRFKPYFYAPPNEVRDINPSKDDRFCAKNRFDENGDPFHSIRGTELTQVKAHIPRTVGSIRDDYDHYEADVLFPDRFLVDKGIKSGVRVPAKWDDNEDHVINVREDEVEPADVAAEPRVHMVDIEVDDRNGFPEADDAEEEILCITAYDSHQGEYVVWYYESEDMTGEVPDEVPDYEFISDDRPDVDIRTFSKEDAMMADYIAHVESTGADLLVGWNMDDFDAPYIVNRLENLNESSDRDLDPDRLSRINEVWGGGWGGPNIKGRVVFDLLEAYKRTQFTELDSYRLEAVGQSALGMGKERFDGDIGDLWEEDPTRMIEYNLRDVEICVELDNQQDIISFWDEVRKFVGCRIQDAPIPGDAVDMYVLHKTNGRFVLPSKGTVENAEEFEGGEVFDPVTDIVDWVTVLDLKSLYPMSMCTINASPDTKVDPDEYDGETYRSPLIEPEGASREPFRVHFKKDEDGIIREMVDELLTERELKKERRNEHEPETEEYDKFDRQQAGIKVIMNSLYGVSGWDRFRLYDPEMSAATTAVGRECIKFSEQVANELGYEVTYGDTDSIMLGIGDVEPSDIDDFEINDELREAHPDLNEDELAKLQACLDKSFEIEDTINERYEEFARNELHAEEHRFQIEFEKLYRRFLQAGKKKRYSGNIIWKEGKHVDKTDITGFEYQRSDIAGITKTSQKQLIEMLVNGEDLDEVRSYLEELIDDFQNGEISVEQIGIPSGIGQPLDEYDTETAHVRGAKYANLLLGTNFGQASKPKRVYLSRVHPEFYKYAREELNLDPQENPEYGQFKRDPDVICFIHEDQVPEEFEVDWDKMLNKTLQGPLSRVLKAVDITWEDVKSGQQQTGLESFM